MVEDAFLEACKVTRNPRERAVYVSLKKEGYEVYRGGWPDFLAVKDDEPLFVEVKSLSDRLNDDQIMMSTALMTLGFEFEVRRLH
jgi:hypothetical protein